MVTAGSALNYTPPPSTPANILRSYKYRVSIEYTVELDKLFACGTLNIVFSFRNNLPSNVFIIIGNIINTVNTLNKEQTSVFFCDLL